MKAIQPMGDAEVVKALAVFTILAGLVLFFTIRLLDKLFPEDKDGG